MSEKYKLTYFDVRALAEPIRWVFSYANVPFEDDRIPWDYPGWFMNLKKNYIELGGQIPILTIDGDKKLTQSTAISRYLAAEFGLEGKTNWEKAQADQVIAMIFDLFIAWRTRLFEREEKRRELQGKGILPGLGLDDRFKICYTMWNKMLKESDGDYIAGKNLTHADFWLASFLTIWDDVQTGKKPVQFPADPAKNLPAIPLLEPELSYINFTENFPELRAHKERILAIPQIKEWIAKRPDTSS